MLYTIFTELTILLNEYLSAFYDIPEGMAELGMPGASADDSINKIRLFLLNIERETSLGIGCGADRGNNRGGFAFHSPAWHLNLYFAAAAVFEEKRYADALKILSKTMAFLQQHTSFKTGGGCSFTLEPVTLNMQELTNVWSILGGQYHPSVVCKLRILTIDGNEVSRTSERITRPDAQTHFNQ